MEYILTEEEVEALNNVGLEDLENDLHYQVYLENQQATLKA